MIRRMLCALASAGVAACVAVSPGHAGTIDLTTPEGKLQALVKMRASADGKDTFADWQVTAWAVVSGSRPQALFRLDGFNVGRMERQSDGGYRFLSREVAYYRDLATGQILERWNNPFTKEVNDVLQVINDPVNVNFDSPTKPNGRRPPIDVRGDEVVLKLDVPLAYPNPIKPQDYPLESTGEMYLASEHFIYLAKLADVSDDAVVSAPTQYAWTRIGPWLPWMKMGKTPGWIVYVGNGRKLGGAATLDPVVRAYTLKNHPTFMKSPDAYSPTNETSWSYYRKQRPPVPPAAMTTPTSPASAASAAAATPTSN